jgi:hypothetical protein
MSARKLRHYFE